MFSLVIDKKTGLKTGNNNKESGQSLVELALVFTTIVFMLSILVDIGRAFFTLIALNDAAQEGAVHASMHPTYLEVDNNSPWQDTIQMIITSSSEPIDFQAELANGTFRVGYPRIVLNDGEGNPLRLMASSDEYDFWVEINPDVVYTQNLPSIVYHAIILLTAVTVSVVAYYGAKITWPDKESS